MSPRSRKRSPNATSIGEVQYPGGTGTGITTIKAADGTVLTLADDIGGSGTLAIGDSQHGGTVVFGQADASYTGSLTLAAGTLELSAGNQSSGGITFAPGSDAILKIDGSASPANETITGFTIGDTIDLTSIGLATAATLDSATNVLTITGGSSPISLQLAGDYSGFSFGVASDGASGTDIVVVGPHVTTVSAASDGKTDLPAGQIVAFTLASNVALTTIDTTNGLPTLLLSNGKTATFEAAHSTPTSLVFNYTVAATGDDTPDLLVTGLDTHGATLTDAAGHQLTGFGVAALSGGNTHLAINTAPPAPVTPPPAPGPTPSADTRFDLADLTSATSGSFFGNDYTGAVSYLQAQHFYAGSNDVVLGARVANAFMHTDAGSDALVAEAGSNVLDGGGGSNWMVGANGADGGNDTFFADGRTDQHIWDTLVNFHPSDMLTLWGFNPALGSTSWSDNMGAADYHGATLHVGFGNSSGSDALVTFVGLNTQGAKFATSTDTVGGVTYLAVTRIG